jgi:hypothetical protein
VEKFVNQFLDTLSYVAWAVFLGIGLLALILFVIKDTRYRLKISKIKFKADAWLEKVHELINEDKDHMSVTSLEKVLSALENGDLDSALQYNDDFYYLTETIVFNILYKRLKPVQNVNFADAQDSVISAVKKFYVYITETKGYYKMELKIQMASKRKKGFNLYN